MFDGGVSTNAIATGGVDRFNNSAIGVGSKGPPGENQYSR
jgi:hypothetical protein